MCVALAETQLCEFGTEKEGWNEIMRVLSHFISLSEYALQNEIRKKNLLFSLMVFFPLRLL